MLVSGGAPLSAATQHFAQAVFCPVAQGYGATETTGCATVQEVRAAETLSLVRGLMPAAPPMCAWLCWPWLDRLEDVVKNAYRLALQVLSVDGRPADLGAGRVGAIQPACELKLVDVPEMGYYVADAVPSGGTASAT